MACECDEHHSKGWCRELWLQSLGMKAVLPPPEERKHVTTAISAARAEQASVKNRWRAEDWNWLRRLWGNSDAVRGLTAADCVRGPHKMRHFNSMGRAVLNGELPVNS